MTAKGTTPDDAAWAAAKKHRPNYAKPLAEYHSVYGVKERGVKKWLEKARLDWINAGSPSGGPEFPPLDDPPKMLPWWFAHMTLSPSSTLYELAGVPPTPDTAADAKPAAASAPPLRTAVDVTTLTGLDLADAALKQRQLLAATHAQLVAAQANPNTPEATITLLSKRWDETVERLRKVEDSLAAAEKSRGMLVHVNDLRAEMSPILTTLATSLASELHEHLGIDRARTTLFVDRWFRHLRGTRFLDGIVPSLSPDTAAA